MVEQGSKTAPDSARERFLESLPSRADELEPWVRAYRADRHSLPALSALRRGLYALSAGARRFELHQLVVTLQRLTVRVEATALGDATWTAADDRALTELLESLRGSAAVANTTSGVHASPALVPSEQGPDPRRSSRPPPSAAGEGAAALMNVRVLLVCSRPHAAELRELLDDSPLQLLHAADPEQALSLLHTAAPACAFVAAEFATLPDIDLVRRLQTDPLSRLDGVYLLLPTGASYDADFLRQTGADGVLIEPLSTSALSPVIERATRRRGRGGLRALQVEREGTVDEIASYVAEEIRTGIAEALRAGPNERIQLSDTEALAEVAASAIGRVRSHLAVQSRGRVSFDQDQAEDESLAPPAADGGGAISLHGTRVLVVDDDAAVRWFFVGLLREAGAEVVQAQDGRDALELARRRHPHVVLSDILMPRVDGFALCRELRRDVLLHHVPVILLSWKEDLLERMRELDAGASGYLRKEARGGEVVRAVAAAIATRRALCDRLKGDGEATGRIEDMGVLALLESVAAYRPDARIRVNDAWNMFEVEIRAGQRIALTRTAADGSFVRGERALAQLVGVSSGRFSVWPSQTSLRGALKEPFAVALERAGKTLASVLDAVSDGNLLHVARLAFDENEIDQLLRLTPTRLHEVVTRFRSGDVSAQQLLLRGSFTPAELEGHLRELARRGAITGVWNARGEDLIAAAWREREDEPGRLLHSSAPPANPAWFSSLKVGAPPWAAEDIAAPGGVTKMTTVAVGALDPAAADEIGRVAFASSRPPPQVVAAEGGEAARADAWEDEPITGVAAGRAGEVARAVEDESSSQARDAAGAAVRAAFDEGSATHEMRTEHEDLTSPRLADAAMLSALAAVDDRALADGATLVALTPHEGARVIASPAALADTARHEDESLTGEAIVEASPASQELVPDEGAGALENERTMALDIARQQLSALPGADEASAREDEADAPAREHAEEPREAASAEGEHSSVRPRPAAEATAQASAEPEPGHASATALSLRAAEATLEARDEPEDASAALLDKLLSDEPQATSSAVVLASSTATPTDAQTDSPPDVPLDTTADAPQGHADAARKPADGPTLPDPNARARTLISAVLSGRPGEPPATTGDEPVTRPLTAAEIELARASKWGELSAPVADLPDRSSSQPASAGPVESFDLRTLDPNRTMSEFSPAPSAEEEELAGRPNAEVVQTDHAPLPLSAATEAPDTTPRVATKRRKLREHVQLSFTLAALAAVGYVGQRYVTAHGGVSAVWNTLTHTSAPPTAATHRALETSLRSGTDPSLVAGESLPYIDEGRGVAVLAGQGLLVIEYAGAEPPPHVAVDGHDLGAPPIAVALPAARHELRVQRNLDAAVRTLIVTAGETRIVTLPLSTH